MSRVLGALGCFVLLMLSNPKPASSQPFAAEVVTSQSSMSSSVFDVLYAAFARDGIAVRRSPEPASCSGALATDAQVNARVSLQWTKPYVTLCFQDHCASSRRELGPFVDLDARAREEIITVIESGLTALQRHCSVGETLGAVTASSGDTTPQLSGALTDRSLPDVPEATALPSYEQSSDQAAAASSQLPNVVHTLSAAEEAKRDAHPQHRDYTEQLLLLVARYGIARWSERVLGQYLGAAIAYAVHRYPLFIGIELDYAPPFRALQDELAIDASALRLAFQFSALWRLANNAVLDVQIGPALEWLSLTPAVTSARALRDQRAVAHLDPFLFARAGPALRVYGSFFLGIELQADAAFLGRSYGFLVGEERREVFMPDRFRMSIALQARAEL